MARQALAVDDVQARLETLPGWTLVDGHVHKRYEFGRFLQAIDFVSRLAQVAEAMDHHPDMHITYNRVAVDLMTHDAGGITELDLTLAREADQCALIVQDLADGD